MLGAGQKASEQTRARSGGVCVHQEVGVCAGGATPDSVCTDCATESCQSGMCWLGVATNPLRPCHLSAGSPYDCTLSKIDAVLFDKASSTKHVCVSA
jgi:hypothetical protein